MFNRKKKAALGKHAAKNISSSHSDDSSVQEESLSETPDMENLPEEQVGQEDYADQEIDSTQRTEELTEVFETEELEESAIEENPAREESPTVGFIEPEKAFVAPLIPELSPEEKKARRKKRLRRTGIVFASLIGVVLAVYLAGLAVFSFVFYPQTTMGAFDISLKTVNGAAEVLVDGLEDYQVKVDGQGLSFTLSGADVDLSFDEKEILQKALSDNKSWRWPLQVLESHDESENLVAQYETSGVHETVREKVAGFNEEAEHPINATIAYDEATNAYQLVSEKVGTALDENAVVRVVDKALITLAREAKITSEELLQPLVTQESPALQQARDEANKIASTELTLNMDGFEVTTLNTATLVEWIALNEDLQVVFNEEAFNSWIEMVIGACNTVGTERTYERPDGKQITVSGGSYGWSIDSDALRETIRNRLFAGEAGVIDIPVNQSGTGFAGIGGRDWGNRYCDIDLSEQYARFYDGEGTIVWESPIVSGKPGKNATPTGVHSLNHKQSPSTLIGQINPETKKPEYETPVSFWMPFIGNSVGLHDATWQSSFGGTRYSDGYGSHGCVNLPLDKAREIYDIIQPGDVVITHW